MPTKPAVLSALRARVESRIRDLSAVAEMARDEATSAESKCEDKHDTRATEASYLAAGQGRRLLELRQLLTWVVSQDAHTPCERVALGALVEVEDEEGARRWLFVAPAGGERLEVEETEVQVLSPRSGLGQALMGLEEGDAAEVDGPREMEVEVLSIS